MDRQSHAPAHYGAADAFASTDGISPDRRRDEWLAATESEAAAIVEDARREITATVRRAHDELLAIRAQLQRRGLEAAQIASIGLDERGIDVVTASLDDDVPRDGVVLRRLHVLREAVPDAATSHAGDSRLSAPTVDEPGAPDRIRWWRSTCPSASSPFVIIGVAFVLSLVSAVIGWMYAGQLSQSAASAKTGATIAQSGPRRDQVSAGPIVVPSTKPVAEEGEARVLRRAPADTPSPVPGSAGQVPAPTAPTADTGPVTGAGPQPAVAANIPSFQTPEPSRPSAVTTGNAAVSALPPTVTPGVTEPDRGGTGGAAAQVVDAAQQAAILATHVRWLDAYGRGDQRAMAALTAEGFSLRDERAGRSANVAAGPVAPMQVSGVHIDIAGPGAVLTARVRASDGAASESLLSEVWVRDERQQWALLGVRITPVDAVPQPGR